MKNIILILFTLFLLVGCCGKKKCCSPRKSMRWCPDSCNVYHCEPCKYDTVKECDDPCYGYGYARCKKCFHCGECLECDRAHLQLKGCPELAPHSQKANFFTCNKPEVSLMTRNY